MTRDLFWAAVAEYGEPSHDGWLTLMRFIDGRDDYSLAMFESDLEAVSTELQQRYEEVVAPQRRLPQMDIDVAVENACLLGRGVFDSVMASPDSLRRYVDGALGDVLAEERATYREEN